MNRTGNNLVDLCIECSNTATAIHGMIGRTTDDRVKLWSNTDKDLLAYRLAELNAQMVKVMVTQGLDLEELFRQSNNNLGIKR